MLPGTDARAAEPATFHQAVGPDWIDRLRVVAERELTDPGEWVTDTNPGAGSDRLFTSRYLRPFDPEIREFVLNSGIAGLVGQLLGASCTRIYIDHTLVKEPATTAPTLWHRDRTRR